MIVVELNKDELAEAVVQHAMKQLGINNHDAHNVSVKLSAGRARVCFSPRESPVENPVVADNVGE